MSEFDEEEERRKLREKYEQDREKREATQRMSELLLKGATMTNKHCDRCGDPIFRYQGQEFCPTCQREQNAQEPDQQETTQPGQDAQSGADRQAEPETAQQAEPGTARQGQTAEPGTETSTEEAPGGDDAGVAASDQSADAASASSPPGGPSEPGQRPAGGGTSRAGGREPVPSTRADEGDLDAATASLRRTVTKHAEAAERATDPRRAQDHLAVVRDAAEALAALDR